MNERTNKPLLCYLQCVTGQLRYVTDLVGQKVPDFQSVRCHPVLQAGQALPPVQTVPVDREVLAVLVGRLLHEVPVVRVLQTVQMDPVDPPDLVVPLLRAVQQVQ